MSSLYLVHYPDQPLLVPEAGKVTIGRADTNTIVLTESRVSRLHAQLEYRYSIKSFIISDLGSANGTYLNNQRIPALNFKSLCNWDKIRVASAIFTVRFVDNPAEITSEFKELSSRVHLDATEVVALSDILTPENQAALYGNLAHLHAVELFQMLEHGAKSGILSLKTDIGNGEFIFFKGKILSATFGKTKDEQAIYAILRCNKGSFEFTPKSDIAGKSRITMSTTTALIEGCRLLDEATAKGIKTAHDTDHLPYKRVSCS